MEYTIEQVRLLYRSSPAKVYTILKTGDLLYADARSIPELQGILSVCKLYYDTHKLADKGIYEFIIR